MTKKSNARAIAGRLIEAATWQLRMSDPEESTRQEFEIWLGDPENAKAWEQLMAPWNLIGEHANDQKMVSFRQAALSDAKRTSFTLNRPKRKWGVALAAGIVMAIVASGIYQWMQRPDDYSTAFGERRLVTLSDGSKLSLDSDSEVTVRYSSNSRQLHLLRGQARFDVAHDVERPFSVVARDQKVIATGTAFNIDITQPKVLVTLIEGHVVVLDASGTAQSDASLHIAARQHPPVELRAGQQLAALPDRSLQIQQSSDIQQAVAWTSGQLIFDDQPLSEVVKKVNHYSNTPIAIADPKVGRLRISGSFNTGDVAGFLDIVTRFLPVERAVDESGRVTLRAK